MSYRFEHPDHLAGEIRRVATERLSHAIETLREGLAENPEEAVHTARKDLKKTRSLMRLARGSLDPFVYRAENDRLREAAHQLSGAREADAKVEALESLIESAGPTLSSAARTDAASWLDQMRRAAYASSDVTRAASEAVVIIARAHDNARLWALGYESFGLIAPGIRRTYRGGRRGLRRAIEDPSDHTVHEWRKRVKDLWYSLRLLGLVWEPVIRPLADQAHELSEILGDHHDLGEVRLAIESGGAEPPPVAPEELLAAIRAKQDELYEAAISLGRRLYSEKPRRYAARLEGLWSAWEEDTVRQVEQGGLPGS